MAERQNPQGCADSARRYVFVFIAILGYYGEWLWFFTREDHHDVHYPCQYKFIDFFGGGKVPGNLGT
jgi:hypothetical protein